VTAEHAVPALMRLDRLITLELVRPVQRAWCSLKRQTPAAGANGAIPVLMYHSITDSLEAGTSPYYRVNTSPGRFREHLRFLAENGYRTISLSALVERLCTVKSKSKSKISAGRDQIRSATNSKLIVITFDDGFRNFATHAFPALQEHGFTATMFLPTAFIQDERKSFKGTECLTWCEVREMRQAGIEFGSHTVNHPMLVDLPLPQVRNELRQSKAELEQNLGEAVSTFCYPYAYPQGYPQFVEVFTREVAAAGYRCCTTTRVGRIRPGDDPFCLKRLPVNAADDIALLGAKLGGAYDWFALLQSLSKRLRRLQG
jgi:peptidoglycan/xylan/chitin deacetylase (PgdA/CDA1 family)